ncbi:MAG: FAD-dependent oxidoreductase, partial [Chloroflexota bacterium]|nr:FAD-dependent oxidoreductase [Chloroflexota bacterium]
MGTASSVDLVVVGAGAAGLGAARTARELGLETVVFEAMPRIGGRAHTDPRPFGVPWDRGCHWLHSADVNPFTRLADAYAHRYRSTPVPRRLHLGDRWATEEEQATFDQGVETDLGAAAALGRQGTDVPLADAFAVGAPWACGSRMRINAEWGVDPEAASTRDDAAYRDTDRNWPVEDGYGALVARHAAGIPVTLSTPVERIAWGGDRVRVATPRGTVEAGAVLVTVSTGVLAADLIRFDPPLPDWKREDAAAVPLGAANKVAFLVDGARLGVDRHTNVVAPVAGGYGISFQLRPFGWDLANAYLAGPLCDELERAGEAAMADVALAALRSIVGNDVARHVRATACTTWRREPSILGAYAAARPGQAHRRADLATPLDDRVFFAGEATSPDFFSTCHGAHLSGVAAARAAVAALGRA